MSEHTSVPWTAHQMSVRTWEIRGPDGLNVCRTYAGTLGTPYAKPDTTIAANAEFIVRACNSHDELLEACKEALGALAFVTDKPGVYQMWLRVKETVRKATGEK